MNIMKIIEMNAKSWSFNLLSVKGISFKCKMTNINENIRNASIMLTTITSVAINLSLEKFE